MFVWDASGEGERGLVRLPSGDVVQDMALTPDGAWLAACGGGSAGVWSARTLQPEHLLSVTAGYARAVCLSPDGRTLACGTDSGHVQVWDLAGGTEQSFKAHDERVTQLAFGPDEGTLISIGWDGALKLWDAASGALRGILHQGADKTPASRCPRTAGKSPAAATKGKWSCAISPRHRSSGSGACRPARSGARTSPMAARRC